MKNILLLFTLLCILQFSLSNGVSFVFSKTPREPLENIIIDEIDTLLVLEKSEALTGNIIPFDTTVVINKITSDQIIYYVNQERSKHDLLPINFNTLLSFSAYEKLLDMRNNNYFSYISPYEPKRDFADFIKDEGYDFLRVSENLAFGYFNSASEVVNEWMKNKQHRANILYPDWKDVGVSVYQNIDGSYYIVQHFGVKKKTCPELTPGIKNEIQKIESIALKLKKDLDLLEQQILEREEDFSLTTEKDNELISKYNLTIKEYNANVEYYTKLINDYNEEVDTIEKCKSLR